MKIKKIIFSILFLLCFVNGNTIFAAQVSIFRLYNENTGEHLYTPDENEYAALKQFGWNDEGIGWVAPEQGEPVYRLNNDGLKNHLYTTNKNEVEVLVSQHGWTEDFSGEPLFYSGGENPVYRLYNEKLNGMHLLTTDSNEYNTLPSHQWSQEGIAFYALELGINNPSDSENNSNPEVNRALPYNNPDNIDKLVESNPKSYYNRLDDNEKPFYKIVLEAVRNKEESAPIKDVDANGLIMQRTVDAIKKDHPELFYLTAVTNFTSTSLYLKYDISDINEIEQKQKELDEWGKRILSSINSNQNDYDLALEIHDYIVLHTSYDYGGMYDLENQSIMSVVEKGKTVCAGYTKAFQYLLNRAGIFATQIDGFASGTFVGEHLWNLVQLDGNYSFVDVTFDDPSDIWLGREYFAISKEEISKNHIFASVFFKYDDL